MDFDFSEEQQLLSDTTRELLARSYDTEKRRAVLATELGWDRQVWRRLAELGVLGLPFEEADGGAGAGPVEMFAVLVELGRRLVPEPVLDAVYVPGGLIAAAGSAGQRGEFLPQLASGELLAAFAHAEPGSRWPATAVATTASRVDDGWVVTGRKNPVLHGDCAELFVVSAALPDGGVGLFLVRADAVARTGYRTFDGGRGAQLDLDRSAAVPLGSAVDAIPHLQAADVRAQAGLCAEAFGAMSECLRLTTEYLKTRKQFGVPLATFQTLTQRAADMYVSLELAHSMALYATMSLADGVVDPIIASRTKLQVSRSARHIGQESIQLHGGIGVTAEYPVGHYVSRLTAIERILGSADDHLRVLSARVGDYAMAEL